jgi:hypothetical protein
MRRTKMRRSSRTHLLGPLALALALSSAGCDALTHTRSYTELTFAPAGKGGAAATPALLESIRAGLERTLAREKVQATVRVAGDRVQVVLAPGLARKTLEGLRTRLCRPGRVGFHEVDADATRTAGENVVLPAQFLSGWGSTPVIVAPDRRAAIRTAKALRPLLAAGWTAAIHRGRDPRYTAWTTWEVLILAPAALDEGSIAEAAVGLDGEEPVVLLRLDGEGTRALAALSEKLVSRRIALVVNGKVVMAPTVTSAMRDGRVKIRLGDGLDAAKRLARARRLVARLTRGSSIPVPLKLVSERTLAAAPPAVPL